jgi:hypothetical protein
MEIFGNDAGVPGSSGCCDQSRYQIRKNARKDEFAPLGGRAVPSNVMVTSAIPASFGVRAIPILNSIVYRVTIYFY